MSTLKKKTLTFTIEDGQVTVEADGFTGTACEAATKMFTDALGGETSNKIKKPEYHQRAQVGTAAVAKAGGGS